MSVRIKLKGYDIVVLPFEGKVLGRLRKDGTRKEIFTSKNNAGYHRTNPTSYPEGLRSRLIWFAVNGPIPDSMQINHINHNRADDRITNLELVTCQQNSIYRQITKKNTSGFIGVFYDKRAKNYRGQLRVNKVAIHLGHYATAEEAARAYDAVAREWSGRHAVLNFPDKEVP